MSQGPLQTVVQHLRRLAGASEEAGQSDVQLLRRYLAGDADDAFGILVERHGRMVLGVCRRILRNHCDAEDAFQAAFLVLARKAASIAKQESLSSWLYQVAFRIACKAKAKTKDYVMEKADLGDVPATENSEGSMREWKEVLDAEIHGLPEKYRRPIVLCYLEGMTNEEAALLLRCPTATVKTRLMRARDRLHRKLTERGVALTSTAFTAMLAQQASAATLPTPLVSSTISAANALAAGKAVSACGASATAIALTEGVIKEMFYAKIKMTLAALLCVAVFAGGAGLIAKATFAQDGPRAKVAVPNEKKPERPKPPKVQPPPSVTGKLNFMTFKNVSRVDEKLILTGDDHDPKLGRAIEGPQKFTLTLHVKEPKNRTLEKWQTGADGENSFDVFWRVESKGSPTAEPVSFQGEKGTIGKCKLQWSKDKKTLEGECDIRLKSQGKDFHLQGAFTIENADVLFAPPVKGEPVEEEAVKIVAQGAGGSWQGKECKVIRSQDELKKATVPNWPAEKQLAKMLQGKEIDWKVHTLLVVQGEVGKPRDNVYPRFAIAKITKTKQGIKLQWTLLYTPRNPNTKDLRVWPPPALLVLIDRFDGKVEFIKENAAAAVVPIPNDVADKGAEVKVLAQGLTSGRFKPPGCNIFRSAEELRKACDPVFLLKGTTIDDVVLRDLKIKKIDWKTQSLLFLEDLDKIAIPGSYSCTLVDLRKDESRLKVRWYVKRFSELVERSSAYKTPRIVLIDRFDGKVEFVKMKDGSRAAAEPKNENVRIIAQAIIHEGGGDEGPDLFTKKGCKTIRSRDEYQKILNRTNLKVKENENFVARALKVKEIDWKTQTLLVLEDAEMMPNAGHECLLMKMAKDKKSLVVHWMVDQDGGDFPSARAPGSRFILIERFDGDVKFVKMPAVSGNFGSMKFKSISSVGNQLVLKGDEREERKGVRIEGRPLDFIWLLPLEKLEDRTLDWFNIKWIEDKGDGRTQLSAEKGTKGWCKLKVSEDKKTLTGKFDIRAKNGTKEYRFRGEFVVENIHVLYPLIK